MTEERDIVKFALPFTAGISTAWLLKVTGTGFSSICIPIFLILGLSLMMSGKFRFLPRPAQWSVVYSSIFLTGMISFTAAFHMDLSSVEVRSFGKVFYDSVNNAIESLPFRKDSSSSESPDHRKQDCSDTRTFRGLPKKRSIAYPGPFRHAPGHCIWPHD